MQITFELECPQVSDVVIEIILSVMASCSFLVVIGGSLEVLPDRGGICHCKVYRVNKASGG